MSVNEKMTAIADVIRDKTGGTEALNLDQMAEAVPVIFERGRQARYDEFWDSLQNNGERTSYQTMFANPKWTDDIFNPKHDLVGSTFYRCWQTNTSLTRIPKTIDGRSVSTSASTGFTQMCYGMTALETIFNIIPRQEAVWTNAFQSCSKLKNVTFDGENGKIGQNISFADSPLLSSLSVDSIIGALKTLEEGETAKTLTFYSKVRDNLTDAQKAEITITKGWTLA